MNVSCLMVYLKNNEMFNKLSSYITSCFFCQQVSGQDKPIPIMKQTLFVSYTLYDVM